jgi:tryptophan 2,3-dioxygenase
MELTYASYLGTDKLLDLQHPRSSPPEHDEMLFIVIHQSYELWFKLLLHELEKIKADFRRNDLFGAVHTFKRVRTVMKSLVGQLDILETMTPMSFTSFRNRLDTASGFQSVQFRELEFLLGYKRPEMIQYHKPGMAAHETLTRRFGERSVVDYFYMFLQARAVPVPARLLERDVTLPTEASEEVQRGILDLYRNDPAVGILFELMTDFDEGLLEWRYRHVMLVARTIGEKRGTGGSLGVGFLKKSLFHPLFPDLWAIRHEL